MHPAAPQPPLNAAALPTGRRTRRIFSLDGVIAEYDTVVQLVNSGLSKSAALEQINISRSQFSRKRCIAEAAKVDLPGVQHALLQLREVTLPKRHKGPLVHGTKSPSQNRVPRGAAGKRQKNVFLCQPPWQRLAP